MADKDITVGRPFYNPDGGGYDVVQDAVNYLKENNLRPKEDLADVVAEYQAMDDEGKARWREEQYDKAVKSSVELLLKSRRYQATKSEDILVAAKMYALSADHFLGLLGVPAVESAVMVGMAFALHYPELAQIVFDAHNTDDDPAKLLDDDGVMVGRAIELLWNKTGEPTEK